MLAHPAPCGSTSTRLLAVFLSAALISACIPWPRKATLRQRLEVAAFDEDGGVLLDVQVTLVRFSYPHARANESWTEPTSDGGVASFAEHREWETIWPLLPHGIPFYDFAWCAEAPSRAAQVGLAPRDGGNVAVFLAPGDAGCPSAQDVVDRARLGGS
ncbi:MAG: hypothetical protein AB1938_18590 [Myxococcota bacterium]